jgi:hypothetical protein
MIDPHANQIKRSDCNDCCRDNNKGTHLSVVKCGFGSCGLAAFQGFFVDALTMVIFDPSGETPCPLLLNNLKRAIRIVG